MSASSSANSEDRTALVTRACAGDADALQALLLHGHGHLHRLVNDTIGTRYRRYIDADDVLQETYVTLFAGGLPGGDVSPAAFHRWVERVALNKLRDAQRALRRRRRDIDRNRHPGTHDDLLARLTAGGTTPSGMLAREEARIAVHIAFARLPDAQREVLRLRVMEGMPLAQVAARIGRTEGAAWGLWTRALKNLRAYLGATTEPR